MTVEHFRNLRTGITWSVNPGSPEHTRMTVTPGEFVRVEPEPPEPTPEPTKPKRRRKPEPEPEPEPEEAD